jgi:hypothetical protein
VFFKIYMDLPLNMLNIDVMGLVRSENMTPREKIWTPDPEKYSITACIGNAFAGLIQTHTSAL